jgi:hypothetical protein
MKKARTPCESFSYMIKRSLEMRPKKLSDAVGNRTLSREGWNVASQALAKAERKTIDKLLVRNAWRPLLKSGKKDSSSEFWNDIQFASCFLEGTKT